MPEFTLSPRPPLLEYARDFDGLSLREVTDLAILSIAIPLGGEAALTESLMSTFGTPIPPIGKSHVSKDSATRCLGLGRDQLFVLFQQGAETLTKMAALLAGTAYTTDQSDVWIALEISGVGARDALERICPLDLHKDSFAVDAVARTAMEHLGTIVVRTGEDTFVLLSASSSAHSFLHALETSINNITPSQHAG